MTGLYASAPSAPQWTASSDCESVGSFYCLSASSFVSVLAPATISRVLLSSGSGSAQIGTRTMSASGGATGNVTYTTLVPVDAASDGALLLVTLEYAVDGALYNLSSTTTLLSFYQDVRST